MPSQEKKSPVEEAKDRLLQVVPHLRLALKEAAELGGPAIGILAITPDGGGKVFGTFEIGTFVEDIALVVNAPPQTEESEMEAKALQFVEKWGLKK